MIDISLHLEEVREGAVLKETPRSDDLSCVVRSVHTVDVTFVATCRVDSASDTEDQELVANGELLSNTTVALSNGPALGTPVLVVVKFTWRVLQHFYCARRCSEATIEDETEALPRKNGATHLLSWTFVPPRTLWRRKGHACGQTNRSETVKVPPARRFLLGRIDVLGNVPHVWCVPTRSFQ